MHRGQHAVAFEFRRVFSRRATQLGWQAELQRWAATQLSAAHPNHEHIAILWSVQSQQCASLDDAFRAADELVKLPMEVVKTRPMWAKIEEMRGRMSTVDEFAGILAADHGALPRVDRSMTPVLWSKVKRPPEYAVYANHPLVKGLIRHTAAQFRQVETLFGLREAAKSAEKPAAKPARPAHADAPTQRRRLTFKEKKEYDELDEAIPRLEAEKAAIENALSSGTLSAAELQEKSLALSRLIEELDEKSMRWLELGEWI